jgi:hypothetical protein
MARKTMDAVQNAKAMVAAAETPSWPAPRGIDAGMEVELIGAGAPAMHAAPGGTPEGSGRGTPENADRGTPEGAPAAVVVEAVVVEAVVVEAVAGPGAGVTVSVAEVVAAETMLAAGTAAAPTVEGYIDGLDSRWHVVGWARSLQRDDERLKVELLENDRAVCSDMAMRFRGDLLDARLGDGKYGFQLSIPGSLFDGMRHEFAVRVALPAEQAVLGRLEISLPSRLPKSAGVQETTATVTAAKLVETVLGGGVAQPAHYLDSYVAHLTKALDAVAREYDFATALALLYVHILRRRIDEGGLQTRLTRLSKHPEQLGDVVREVVQSDEAQSRIKKPSGYHLPDLEAIRAWTRLRPIT